MKKIILAIFLISIILFGSGFLYFRYQHKKISNIEKEIAELKTRQSEQNRNFENLKQHIDDVVIFDWKLYSKKDIISFRYPKFSSFCDNSSGEEFNIAISLRGNCRKSNMPENGLPDNVYDIFKDDFVFKIIYKQKDIKYPEDVLKIEGMENAKKIKTLNWKDVDREFLTEWYLENKDIYMIIILYPSEIGNPVSIIKSSNYQFWPSNKPIVDLIIQSIRFP